MVVGVTFDMQKYKSKDNAKITSRYYQLHEGIIDGCGITNTSSSVIVEEGLFLTQGFTSKIQGEEVVSINSLKDGKYYFIYEIDLTKENTEILFNQGLFKIINTVPVHGNVYENELYQQEFANFDIVNGVISNFKVVISQLTGDTITTNGGTVNGDLKINGNLTNNGVRIPTIRIGNEMISDNVGEDGDIFFLIER